MNNAYERLKRLGELAVRLKAAAQIERDPERRALLEETAEATMEAIAAVTRVIGQGGPKSPRCTRCNAVWERAVFDVCPVCIRPDPISETQP